MKNYQTHRHRLILNVLKYQVILRFYIVQNKMISDVQPEFVEADWEAMLLMSDAAEAFLRSLPRLFIPSILLQLQRDRLRTIEQHLIQMGLNPTTKL